jgi:plastocyanin
MKPMQRRLNCLALGSLLCLHSVLAAGVAVAVTNQSGAPVADTILVFDPLDATPTPAHESATIDQVDKKFVPRVNVLRTGTSVTFPNSDHIRHQVYSFSKPKVFTLKLYAGSPAAPVMFDQPGLVILGCNIHDKMSAFVAVVDSPYFAKTDAAGAATLNMPAGRYRLRVWQPALAEPVAMQEVAVTGAAASIAVQVKIDPAAGSAVPWPE